MADCSNNTYNIFYTNKCRGLPPCEGEVTADCCNLDENEGPVSIGETIEIPKSAYIDNEADVVFLGKTRLEYGEVFNENVLHLLEHFANPAIEIKGGPHNNAAPDTDASSGTAFMNSRNGQLWFNSTNGTPYFAVEGDGVVWNRISMFDDVAGNHGIIAHGEQIPLPIPLRNQYNDPDAVPDFNYSDCSWIVTPLAWDAEIKSFTCETDDVGNVTVQYTLLDNTVVNGLASYAIIAIRDNISPIAEG